MVHIKANYPLLNPTGSIQAPTPATLRITDGRQGRVETLRTKEMAFQLIVEEAREASENVAGCSIDREKAHTE